LGEYDKVLRVFNKLIVIDSEIPEVWNFRGNLLTESIYKAVELDYSEMMLMKLTEWLIHILICVNLMKLWIALMHQFI
jgi:hypothetical protein